MITRVKVKNFRNLADVDVELGPMTVLVGRNGVGKSTFLDVLRFVRDALRLGLDTAIRNRDGIPAIRRWVSQNEYLDLEIMISIENHDIRGEYTFTIGSNQAGEYRVKHEGCYVTTADGDVDTFETRDGEWKGMPLGLTKLSETRGGSYTLTPEASMLLLPTVALLSSQSFAPLLRQLTRTSFYSIYPDTLRRPQKPANEVFLLDGGENLSTVLQQIEQTDEPHHELVTALERVVDDVSGLRVKQIGTYLVTELQHKMSLGGVAWFELAQESDGTLRILGLLVALYQETRQTLIAPEEPEMAIHPGALAVLSDVLQEASQRTQVLITTQSPDLISRFNADQLRVVERVNGVTRIGPIDELQRGAINDQLFSAGDLLRIEDLHVAPTVAAA